MTDPITTPAEALSAVVELCSAAEVHHNETKDLSAAMAVNVLGEHIRAIASRIPEPDGDVVERVARAIAGVDRCALPHETLCPSPDGCMCRMRARAAIAAMPDQSAEVERLGRALLDVEPQIWEAQARAAAAEAERDRMRAALTEISDTPGRYWQRRIARAALEPPR